MAHSDMQTLVARTARLKVVYVSLQSVLIILTLARWMAIADAVPRVGVIVRTLRQATTAFTELSLVFLLIGLPIGVSLVMTVGARVEAFSTPHKMLQQLGEESIACTLLAPYFALHQTRHPHQAWVLLTGMQLPSKGTIPTAGMEPKRIVIAPCVVLCPVAPPTLHMLELSYTTTWLAQAVLYYTVKQCLASAWEHSGS